MFDAPVDHVRASDAALDRLRAGQQLGDHPAGHAFVGDPGTGLSALANLLRRGLARRVVLTSGAPPERLPHGVDYVLPKPFDLDALLQALLPARAFKAAARAR